MCGICGIYHYDNKQSALDGELAKMSELLRHRGPDGIGFWSDGSVGFGHRRLAIIDMPGGAQPISNESGNIQVCANGEIYNHEQLRAHLASRGHTFKSRCDTEVIIHLYEEKGVDFLKDLDGMFAIALWDRHKQILMLARDRAGIKPLVYYHGNGSLVFASELRSLLAHPAVPKTINPQALHLYFNHEFVPTHTPLLNEVRRLKPAEVLVVGPNGIEKQEFYWETRFAPKLEVTERDAIVTFQELFSGSVKKQLMSDVPLGAFLSGGIDSSSIVAQMSKHAQGKIKTFTIGFEDHTYDELSYASTVAERFGTDHHVRVLRLDGLHIVEKVLDRLDEPLADLSAIPTFLLSEFAREHVTVCLSGDGSDELLCGYERHLASLLCSNVYDHVPELVRKKLIEPLASLLPVGSGKKNPFMVVRRFLEGASKPDNGRQMRWQSFMSQNLASLIYTKHMQAIAGEIDAFAAVSAVLQRTSALNSLDMELGIEQNLYLPDDILLKMDCMSMAVSLEVRVPFLDHELVEFVNRLPVGMKRRWFRGKHLLRSAMRGELPETILNRRKQGFSMPIGQWLRGTLHDRVETTFSRKGSPLDEYINRDGLRRLLAEHREGVLDHTHQIWAAFVLCEWFERNVE